VSVSGRLETSFDGVQHVSKSRIFLPSWSGRLSRLGGRRSFLEVIRLRYEVDSSFVHLEQLIDFPPGEHTFQNSAVIGVRKSNELAGKPPIELRLARPAAS
jgi:hypothetical protein